MPHMPTTGVSGVDLYSIDSDGQWRFYFGGYPSGDTLQYHYTNIGKDLYHDRGYEFRLYLPPYNTIKWLEIGVPKTMSLRLSRIARNRFFYAEPRSPKAHAPPVRA